MGLRISKLYPLQKSKTLPHPPKKEYDSKMNLVVRVSFLSFESVEYSFIPITPWFILN